MLLSAQALTALIGSRICHDLISPLGAIGNGVELLMMSGSAPGPEMSLISESVANANARLRFFRVAFGAAGADQRMRSAEVIALLDDLCRGGRLHCDWRIEGEMSRREVKRAFIALQCLESAMPWGGQVVFDRDDGQLRLCGHSSRFRIEPGLWAMLTAEGGPPELAPPAARDEALLSELTAAQVHFVLLVEEAAALGFRIHAEIGEDRITLLLRAPRSDPPPPLAGRGG